MSEDGRKEKKGNMKANRVVCSLLCTTCISVMLWFASNRTIVIADVSQEQSGLSVNVAQPGKDFPDSEIPMSKTYDVQGSFCVPLPEGVKAENVFMENRYMDRELWLYIQSDDVCFYKENEVGGDISPILWGRSEEQEEGMLLKFGMNHVLEYRSTMEGNELIIAWYEPHELYEYIIVLDPAGGGRESGAGVNELWEKDVALQVARQVQRKFALQDVRLYVTRTEDVDVPPEDRIGLANEVNGDLYIRLCTVADPDNAETYGILGFYNEEFFIPDFGNVDLANIAVREVTIASSNRALGLEAADEYSILKGLRMPAAEISLGCLSNPQEGTLLGQESYQEKLAEGIIAAIEQAVRETQDLKR